MSLIRRYADLYEMQSNETGIMIVARPTVRIPTLDDALYQDLTEFFDQKGYEFFDTDDNAHNLPKNIRTYAVFNQGHPYVRLALNDLGKNFSQGERLDGNDPQGRAFSLDPKLGLFVNKIPQVDCNVRAFRDELYQHLK